MTRLRLRLRLRIDKSVSERIPLSLPESARYRFLLEQHVEPVERALHNDEVDGYARTLKAFGVVDVLGVKQVEGAHADPCWRKP